jgi:hypothetical protein
MDEEKELCDCGKPATVRSHAYGWVACDDCEAEKLQEDIERIED